MTHESKNQVPFQNTIAFKVIVFTLIAGFVLYSAWEKYQQQSVTVANNTPTEKSQTTELPKLSEENASEVTSSLEKLQPLEKDTSVKTAEKTIEKPVVTKSEASVTPPAKTVAKSIPEPKSGTTKTVEKFSGIKTKIQNQSIRDLDGEIIYKGEIDLTETIARIQDNQVMREYRHDGITFENRERRLPQQTPGYYKEWVHPTPKLRGPGPQRVISGKKGEFWYTPNHYSSFIKLN